MLGSRLSRRRTRPCRRTPGHPNGCRPPSPSPRACGRSPPRSACTRGRSPSESRRRRGTTGTRSRSPHRSCRRPRSPGAPASSPSSAGSREGPSRRRDVLRLPDRLEAGDRERRRLREDLVDGEVDRVGDDGCVAGLRHRHADLEVVAIRILRGGVGRDGLVRGLRRAGDLRPRADVGKGVHGPAVPLIRRLRAGDPRRRSTPGRSRRRPGSAIRTMDTRRSPGSPSEPRTVTGALVRSEDAAVGR